MEVVYLKFALSLFYIKYYLLNLYFCAGIALVTPLRHCSKNEHLDTHNLTLLFNEKYTLNRLLLLLHHY